MMCVLFNECFFFLQPKGSKRRAFIDPKKDTIHKFVLTQKAPSPQVSNEAQAEPKLSKKERQKQNDIVFQLQNQLGDKDEVKHISTETFSEAGPSTKEKEEDDYDEEANRYDGDHYYKPDPMDLRSYGITFNDGYDYGQHLYDPTAGIMGGRRGDQYEMVVDTTPAVS